MVLGALIDAGVPLDDIRRALGSLAITPDSVWTERVVRAGVQATKFGVIGEDSFGEDSVGEGSADVHEHAHSHVHAGVHHHHSHDHHHDHAGGHEPHQHDHGHAATHHHAHRTLAEINALIDRSSLSADGK